MQGLVNKMSGLMSSNAHTSQESTTSDNSVGNPPSYHSERSEHSHTGAVETASHQEDPSYPKVPGQVPLSEHERHLAHPHEQQSTIGEVKPIPIASGDQSAKTAALSNMGIDKSQPNAQMLPSPSRTSADLSTTESNNPPLSSDAPKFIGTQSSVRDADIPAPVPLATHRDAEQGAFSSQSARGNDHPTPLGAYSQQQQEHTRQMFDRKESSSSSSADSGHDSHDDKENRPKVDKPFASSTLPSDDAPRFVGLGGRLSPVPPTGSSSSIDSNDSGHVGKQDGKVSLKDKIKGTVQETVGKVTRNDDKVEEGKRTKVFGSEGPVGNL